MVKREIKFRGKHHLTKEWIYGAFWDQPQRYGNHTHIYQQDGDEENEDTGWTWVDRPTVGQFTGLKDKNGKEIYEDDLVIIRKPTIEYQTHVGDNIPNGSYTEPIGVMLEEITYRIKYQGSTYMMVSEEDNREYPLDYEFNNNNKPLDLTRDDFVDAFDMKRNRDLFDDDYTQAEEDLNFLIEEYGKTLEELIEYCKIEVIGNSHDGFI